MKVLEICKRIICVNINVQVWSNPSPVLFIQQHAVVTGVLQRALDVRVVASVTAIKPFFLLLFPKKNFKSVRSHLKL